MRISIPTLLVLLGIPGFAGTSVFTSLPLDPNATPFTSPAFTIHADGKTDDAPALQSAIDKAISSRQGIVFVPSGPPAPSSCSRQTRPASRRAWG